MTRELSRKEKQKLQMDWVDTHPVTNKDGISEQSKKGPTHKSRKRKPRTYSELETDMEIDLHGLTIDEAMFKVESLLKAMKKSGHQTLRVIHGQSSGTGLTIQDQLKRNLQTIWRPLFTRYRREKFNHGATHIYLD